VMSQNSCNNSCKNIPGQMAIPPSWVYIGIGRLFRR